MKKTIAIITALLLVIMCIPSYASSGIKEDFTGYEGSGKPEFFDKWSAGILVSPRPEVKGQNALYSNEETKNSCIVYSSAEVDSSAKPYLQKNLSVSGDTTIHFRLAAADKNSIKTASFILNEAANTAIEGIKFSDDGKLYLFGNEAMEYATEKWYDFDIVFKENTNTCNVLVNGFSIESSQLPLQYSSVCGVKLAMNDKTAGSESAFAIDLLSVDNADLTADRCTDLTLSDATVDNISGVISSLPQNVTKDSFMASVTVPTNAVCRLLKADKQPSEDDTVKTGMYFEITSADAVNRRLLVISNLTVTATALSTRIKLGEDTVIYANIPDNEQPEKIEFYENNVCIKSLSQRPYKFTYVPTSEGSKSIVVRAAVGETIVMSEPIDITVWKNIKPTVTLSSDISDKKVQYGNAVNVQIVAQDTDGEITKTELIMDNRVIYESSRGDVLYAIEGLTLGNHCIVARCTDNADDIVESEAIEFNVYSSSSEEISFEDFSKQNDEKWKLFNFETTSDNGYKQHDEQHGMSFAAIPTGESPYPYLACTTALASQMVQGDVVIECDILATKSTVSLGLFTLRSNGSNVRWNTDSKMESMAFKGKDRSINFELDTWYHLKYEFNLSDAKSMFYVNDELLGTNTALNTDGTLYDVRFDLGSYGGAEVFIDNISVQKEYNNAYIEDAKFFANDVDYGNTAVGSTDKMSLIFSKSMDAAGINADNITVYKGDRAVAVKSVTYDSTTRAANIVFASPLLADTDYRAVVSSNVKTAAGTKQISELIYPFKTGFNNFDIISRRFTTENADVFAVSDIPAGKSVGFECKAQNLTNDDKTFAIVFVAYEKGIMTFYEIQTVSLEKGQTQTFYNKKDYVCNSKPDSIECYFWRGINDRYPFSTSMAIK